MDKGLSHPVLHTVVFFFPLNPLFTPFFTSLSLFALRANITHQPTNPTILFQPTQPTKPTNQTNQPTQTNQPN